MYYFFIKSVEEGFCMYPSAVRWGEGDIIIFSYSDPDFRGQIDNGLLIFSNERNNVYIIKISHVWALSENIFEYIGRFPVAIYYWVDRRQFLINWPEKTSSPVFTVLSVLTVPWLIFAIYLGLQGNNTRPTISLNILQTDHHRTYLQARKMGSLGSVKLLLSA